MVCVRGAEEVFLETIFSTTLYDMYKRGILDLYKSGLYIDAECVLEVVTTSSVG